MLKAFTKKFDEFSDKILEEKPLVIGVTVTWLKPEITNAEINLEGYNLFRCDRK